MGERTSNEMMERLSLQTKSTFPRDFLQRFKDDHAAPTSSNLDEDDVELSLGLSLGGRFGIDKSINNANNISCKLLVRSSSVATILPVVRDNVLDKPGRVHSGLTRTSSLPVESEEEWRKRKELQSLRRLAAKRRRSEKQRSLTSGQRDDYVADMSLVGSSPGPLFGLNKLTSGGRGLSEFESRHRQGSSGRGGEMSSQLQESSPSLNPLGGLEPEPELEPKSSTRKNVGKGSGLACSPEDMPCVFTQGDGPNGRVVEGILYKYGKGEKVKIMCVCHGSFYSPVEFVKHAGGTDFLNPLKHIVVKPSPLFS